jgi:rod shape-determining protein MreB and related proteins
MPRDIALDLGTANTLVYAEPEGIVLREPTLCAVQNDTGEVVAFGEAAYAAAQSDELLLVRPLRHGSITDFDVTERMMRFILDDHRGGWLSQPRVLVAASGAATSVERRAVTEAILAAGARQVLLVDETIAAAIGAGLPIDEPAGTCIVDIGGGTTEVAIISLGGVVSARATTVGGIDFDEAILRLLRDEHDVAATERTAERIKREVASAVPLNDEPDLEIRGRDLRTGAPKEVFVSAKQVRLALDDQIARILDVIRECFSVTPPDLAQDVLDRGITLTGGGSLLRGLDTRVAQETHLPVHLAEDPLSTVAIGAGRALASLDRLRDLGLVTVA